MKNVIFYLFLLTILCRSGFSQVSIETPAEEDTMPSKFIKSYPNKFVGRYIIADKGLRFQIREKGEGKKVVQYEPYGTGFIGFGGIYGKFGLELLIRVPVRSDIDFEKFGFTRTFDFQMNQYGRKFGVDILFQRYKGFYLKNPKNHYSGWSNRDPYPHRSDLVGWKTGFNFYYIFNHKNFSLRSSFIQTERQTRSNGSFVMMGSFFRVSQKGDSSLIPPGTEIDFSPDSQLSNSSYYILGILPGYAHTFVVKEFYLTLSFFLGAGFQKQRIEINPKEIDSYTIRPKSNVRAAAGYNGEKVFMGISFVNDNSTFNVNNLAVVTRSNNLKVFAGMRF